MLCALKMVQFFFKPLSAIIEIHPYQAHGGAPLLSFKLIFEKIFTFYYTIIVLFFIFIYLFILQKQIWSPLSNSYGKVLWIRRTKRSLKENYDKRVEMFTQNAYIRISDCQFYLFIKSIIDKKKKKTIIMKLTFCIYIRLYIYKKINQIIYKKFLI